MLHVHLGELILTLPSWSITYRFYSSTDFYQTYCECVMTPPLTVIRVYMMHLSPLSIG